MTSLLQWEAQLGTLSLPCVGLQEQSWGPDTLKMNLSLNSFSLSPLLRSDCSHYLGLGFFFCREDSTPSSLSTCYIPLAQTVALTLAQVINVLAWRTSSSMHKTHCSSGCTSSLLPSHSSESTPSWNTCLEEPTMLSGHVLIWGNCPQIHLESIWKICLKVLAGEGWTG